MQTPWNVGNTHSTGSRLAGHMETLNPEEHLSVCCFIMSTDLRWHQAAYWGRTVAVSAGTDNSPQFSYCPTHNSSLLHLLLSFLSPPFSLSLLFSFLLFHFPFLSSFAVAVVKDLLFPRDWTNGCFTIISVKLICWFFINWLINQFCLHSIFYSTPPSSYWSTYHTSFPHPCLHMDAATSHATWPLISLGHLVSWGLDASFLTEHRSNNPLLYVSWWPHSSWCMLPVCWSSVWEASRVQINWDCWTSSVFQSFPDSTTGFIVSVHWLGANICIWLSCLLGLLECSHARSLSMSAP